MRDHKTIHKKIWALSKASISQAEESESLLYIPASSPNIPLFYTLGDFEKAELAPIDKLEELSKRGLWPLSFPKTIGEYRGYPVIALQNKRSETDEKETPIPLTLFLWLRAMGDEKPTDEDLITALAFSYAAAIDYAELEEIASGIKPETYNAFAELYRMVKIKPPMEGEAFITYLKRLDSLFTLLEKTAKEEAETYKNRYADIGLSAPLEHWGNEAAREAIEESIREKDFSLWEQSELTAHAFYTALMDMIFSEETPESERKTYLTLVEAARHYIATKTSEMWLRVMAFDIRGYLNALGVQTQDYQSQAKEDAEALRAAFRFINSTLRRGLPEQEGEPRGRELLSGETATTPRNALIAAMDELQPLFAKEDNPDQVAAALDWKAKYDARRVEIKGMKRQISALKKQLKEIREADPFSDEIDHLEAEIGKQEAALETFSQALAEGGRDILVIGGEVYKRVNNLPTRYNDSGEIEISITNREGDSFGIAIAEGRAEAFSRIGDKIALVREEILTKARQTQSAEVCFSNEEIYSIMLDKTTLESYKRLNRYGNLNRAKNEFIEALRALQAIRFVAAKVPKAENGHRKRGEGESIEGYFITTYHNKGKEGVSVTLNNKFLTAAIIGHPYTKLEVDTLRQLGTAGERNAYITIRNIEEASAYPSGIYTLETLQKKRPFIRTQNGKKKGRTIDRTTEDFRSLAAKGVLEDYEEGAGFIKGFTKQGKQKRARIEEKRRFGKRRKKP